jgi:hypothetical protein
MRVLGHEKRTVRHVDHAERHTPTVGVLIMGRVLLAAAMVFFLSVSWVSASSTEESADSLWMPTFKAYSQIRYTHPETDSDFWSVRRLKFMADGGQKDGIHYHLQFIYKTHNASSTDDHPYLQDAYLMLPSSGIEFKIGQFIPPFGYERFQPDYDLDLVDRTDVTNRMAINGNIGNSFARDDGIQIDRNRGPWELSFGLFQGGGANTGFRMNGPLGVARISYGVPRANSAKGFWRTGFAVADRNANDLDLTKAFSYSGRAWQHFQGEDRRVNGFIGAGIGPFRGQAEFFQIWLSPDKAGQRAPQGAYVQTSWQPLADVILAARYESFDPDVYDKLSSHHDLWTAGITYDIRFLHLRIACDFSHPTTNWSVSAGDTVRVQFQWFSPSWRPDL